MAASISRACGRASLSAAGNPVARQPTAQIAQAASALRTAARRGTGRKRVLTSTSKSFSGGKSATRKSVSIDHCLYCTLPEARWSAIFRTRMEPVPLGTATAHPLKWLNAFEREGRQLSPFDDLGRHANVQSSDKSKSREPLPNLGPPMLHDLTKRPPSVSHGDVLGQRAGRLFQFGGGAITAAVPTDNSPRTQHASCSCRPRQNSCTPHEFCRRGLA